MGMVLSEADQVPQHIISSTARRARTTAELAIEAGSWSSSLELTDALYGTSTDGALSVVSGADPGVDHLMLVGHEPTWSALAERLTRARVTVKTATVIAIDLRASAWPTVATSLTYCSPACSRTPAERLAGGTLLISASRPTPSQHDRPSQRHRHRPDA